MIHVFVCECISLYFIITTPFCRLFTHKLLFYIWREYKQKQNAGTFATIDENKEKTKHLLRMH